MRAPTMEWEGTLQARRLLNFSVRFHRTVVLLGPTGSGKTTILDLFQSPTNWTITPWGPKMGLGGVVNFILRELGEKIKPNTMENLSTLKQALLRLWEVGTAPVLMVDDAHTMTPRQVEMFDRIRTLRHQRQIVGPILVLATRSDAILNNLIDYHVFKLPRLKKEEMVAYLRHIELPLDLADQCIQDRKRRRQGAPYWNEFITFVVEQAFEALAQKQDWVVSYLKEQKLVAVR